MLRGQGNWKRRVRGRLKEERQVSRGAQSLFKFSFFQAFFSPDILSNIATLNERTYLKLNSLYQCNAVPNDIGKSLNITALLYKKSLEVNISVQLQMQREHNYHETYLKHTPLICKASDFHLKIGWNKILVEWDEESLYRKIIKDYFKRWLTAVWELGEEGERVASKWVGPYARRDLVCPIAASVMGAQSLLHMMRKCSFNCLWPV